MSGVKYTDRNISKAKVGLIVDLINTKTARAIMVRAVDLNTNLWYNK